MCPRVWLMRNLGGRRVCTWRRWAARRVWPASCSSGQRQCRVTCVIRWREKRGLTTSATNFRTEKDNQCPHASRATHRTQDGEWGICKNWDPRLWKRLFFYHKKHTKEFFLVAIYETNNLITHTCACQKEKSFIERT